MGDISPVDPKLIAILKGLDKNKVPKPFERKIHILDTYIAGTHYYKAKQLAGRLKEGSPLVFRREIDNAYDKKAIAVLDLDKNKLGYLPQKKNEIISKLMDAGKNIYAVIENKKWKNEYLKIDIKVFMSEY